MDQCIFCDRALSPGRPEHVFLAALGGRITTKRAVCFKCNNEFAAGDKVDDSLAEAFLVPRCALMIWTGRGQPPPTLSRKGTVQGIEYVLAPGFVPITRRATPQAVSSLSGSSSFSARDVVDAKRILDIYRAQGAEVKVRSVRRIAQKVPPVDLTMVIRGSSAFRSITKTALTAACVLFGNENVRRHADKGLRNAALQGTPDIMYFAGWDFVNAWPANTRLAPHKSSPAADALPSGFEHAVFVCDVDDAWIAYVTLFGHFRFSVWLGSASGLPAKGLAVNPRRSAVSRFVVLADSPPKYLRRGGTSMNDEQRSISDGIRMGLTVILTHWQEESQQAWFGQLANELSEAVSAATDDTARQAALRKWSEKIARIEFGSGWEDNLDSAVIDASG